MIIWIASYPRSGNTFLRVILNKIFNIQTYSIYDDKGDIGADKQLSEVVGHKPLPKSFDLLTARQEEKKYFIKTHNRVDDCVDDLDKVIYLIRDGRASSASYTKHQNIYSRKNKKYIDTIYGNASMGSWSDHVASWDPENRENTLLIKFEGLVKDPVSYINMISEFINTVPTNGIIPTFDDLNKMNPKFFRTGNSHAWESQYTEEEHLAFWVRNYNKMMEFGYDYNVPKAIENNSSMLLREISNEITYLMKLIFKENAMTQALKEKERYLKEYQEVVKKLEIEYKKNNKEKECYLKEYQEVVKKLEIEYKKNNKVKKNIDDLLIAVDAAAKVSVLYRPMKKINLLKNILNACNMIKQENEDSTHH